ncbi:MAG: hypothetical protein DRO76_05425 [Candidatus Altiarchaeales archaeon]|nr:MAG: hypothetical protein DRO76_05425 [Candidatus Altiarchaeales archaeon]
MINNVQIFKMSVTNYYRIEVIEDILKALEEGDLDKLQKLCKKYSMQYKDDYDVQQVCSEIKVFAELGNHESLEDVKSRFRGILSTDRTR